MIPQSNIPAKCYPFTIIGLRADNREEIWRHVMMSPGGCYVPPLSQQNGGVRIIIRMEFGNEEKLGSTPMEDRAAEKIANMITGLLQTHGPTPIGMATGNREDLEEKGEQIIQQHEQQQRN
jgi:hypothetical protein